MPAPTVNRASCARWCGTRIGSRSPRSVTALGPASASRYSFPCLRIRRTHGTESAYANRTTQRSVISTLPLMPSTMRTTLGWSRAPWSCASGGRKSVSRTTPSGVVNSVIRIIEFCR